MRKYQVRSSVIRCNACGNAFTCTATAYGYRLTDIEINFLHDRSYDRADAKTFLLAHDGRCHSRDPEHLSPCIWNAANGLASITTEELITAAGQIVLGKIAHALEVEAAAIAEERSAATSAQDGQGKPGSEAVHETPSGNAEEVNGLDESDSRL